MGTYSLNAPYGARCFLTVANHYAIPCALSRLNAPYGARCFLTDYLSHYGVLGMKVLMHLMALGAF